MTENKINKLLNLYRKISAFGPSRIQDSNYADRYLVSFTEKDFFEKLYIPTSLEADLYKEVDDLNNGNIVALCGPSGSGKSTVSLKVKFDIENQLRTKLIFLDLRIEESSKTFDKVTTIDDEQIRNLLLSQFEKDFPILLNDEKTSERLSLYYFLLSPEREIAKLKEAQIFLPLQSLNNKTARLYNRILQNSVITFKEWFFDNSNHGDLTDIFTELDTLIDISHYVAYIRHQDKYDKIIFWLDNIDAFTNVQQTQIVDVLEKLQRNILNSTKIVIAVREENIYRVGRFTDNFNEPFVSQITFKDPDNNDAFTNYGAINVPVMSPENISRLIEKKLDFTYEKYIKYGDKLKSQLNRIDAEIENKKRTNISEYNIKREQILKQRNKLLSDINEHENNVISNQEFAEVKKLSDKIIDCFTKEKIIFLANNSLRNYLKIHSEFLSYLVIHQLSKSKTLNSEEYSTSQITTLFLSWIHTVNEYFGIETFNIIEELGRFQNNITKNRIGCFLPYLVLTRIWNDCIHLNGKPSPENNPYVYNIINDLCSDFKYTQQEVRQTIYDLYRQVGGKGNFITFRTKKSIETPEDLDIRTTVRITYRGRVTLGHITNSYGYIRECSERFRNINETDITTEELVLIKLTQICEIHLSSLLQIRNSVFKNDVNWYSHYLRKYGIPLKPTFVRNYEIGTTLTNTKFNRCLYLESVFDSLNSYFHLPNQYQRELTSLSGQFQKYLSQLINNEYLKTIKIEIK